MKMNKLVIILLSSIALIAYVKNQTSLPAENIVL
ncbi:hypothetical protein Xmir_04382 [Xenorhabdus miraniensis]|uniref:Uncharacterized protein n=1 Tax=Xenorhabdus miraniensis TaxID=351674 RepID=A0A2D0JJ54_9GAMM|nr:hypothetical protein Xmir_04382 [Xenorhabdus miraniensis]